MTSIRCRGQALSSCHVCTSSVCRCLWPPRVGEYYQLFVELNELAKARSPGIDLDLGEILLHSLHGCWRSSCLATWEYLRNVCFFKGSWGKPCLRNTLFCDVVVLSPLSLDFGIFHNIHIPYSCFAVSLIRQASLSTRCGGQTHHETWGSSAMEPSIHCDFRRAIRLDACTPPSEMFGAKHHRWWQGWPGPRHQDWENMY